MLKVEELEKLVSQGADAMTVKRVFGEPIAHDGITLIPVARVRGAGGLGAGTGADESQGAGYAVTAHAMGTYVIKGDEVRFVPAVDVNRALLTIAGLVAVLGVFVARPIVKTIFRDR